MPKGSLVVCRIVPASCRRSDVAVYVGIDIEHHHHDYADLLNKIYGVNDVLKEQKKNKKVEDLIDGVIKEPPLTDDY